jgi:fermentation-respiration switch protein FrsA (DUF1100 family)/ketosteroid isomerase-like protein
LTAEAASAQEVRRVSVEFKSGNEKMIGSLYLPGSHKPGDRLCGIVVGGTWTSVKEQMAERYAQQMAKRGFAALSFDFRNYGESGGAPRQYESWRLKSEDITSAAHFLQSRPEIDKDRIGGLAVCASASYMALALASGTPIKSFVTVSAWLHDPQTVGQAYGGELGVRERLEQADAAWKKFETTKAVAYVSAQSATDKSAAMPFPIDFYENEKRGKLPQWTNRFAVMGWRDWLTIDPITPAARITVPTLMIHSEKAAFPDNVRRFYGRLTGPKEILWAEGEHTDFYDKEPQVTLAANAAAAHFNRTLLSKAEKTNRNAAALAGTREFFAALEAMDVPRFLKVWADDGVQEMPYAPGAFPKRLEGKAAIEKQYGPLPTAFQAMRFPIRRLVATEEPGVVLAEYDGSITLKAGGRYDNRYVGVFEFSPEGKLRRYAEYFDPYTLIHGFPGAAEAAMPNEERIERMILEMARAADARDWKTIGDTFDNMVDFDYTSVAGGSPAKLKREEIVEGWMQGLGRYRQTKHNFSDVAVKVEADAATCTFTGQATHVKENGARWSCGGDYTYRFARTPQGWKATTARFDMKWEQGQR